MQKEIKDHNKLFAAAQEKFLANRTDKNLGEIYLVLKDYFENLFIKYSRQKSLNWDNETIKEKAHDASTRMIERFIKKPDFKIDKLTSYGHWDFVKILYQDKDYEMNTSSYEDYEIGIKDNEVIATRLYGDEYDY